MKPYIRSMTFGGILAGVLLASQTGFAADAIVDTDPAPEVEETFDDSRFYVTGFGGVNFITDSTFQGVTAITGAPTPFEVVDLDFDTGFIVGGAIGHRFGGTPFRGEFEVLYSENDVDELDFSGNAVSPDILIGEADFQTVNLAINTLVDVDTGTAFTPYVGAGLGIAFTDLEAAYVPGVVIGGEDENFLIQGIVGASYEVAQDVEFIVEGRYTRIYNIEQPRVAPSGVLTGVGEEDFDTFAITGGFRFNF